MEALMEIPVEEEDTTVRLRTQTKEIEEEVRQIKQKVDEMENRQQEIKEDVTNMLTIMRELVNNRDKESLNNDVTRTEGTKERSRRTRRKRDDNFSSLRFKDTRSKGGEEGYDGDNEMSREVNDNESSKGKETSEIETMSIQPRRGWRYGPRSRRPNLANVTRDLEQGDKSSNIQKMINELKQELDALKRANGDEGKADLIEPLARPLADHVRMANPPKKFKMPNVEKYRGATDPVAHVENFKE